MKNQAPLSADLEKTIKYIILNNPRGIAEAQLKRIGNKSSGNVGGYVASSHLDADTYFVKLAHRVNSYIDYTNLTPTNVINDVPGTPNTLEPTNTNLTSNAIICVAPVKPNISVPQKLELNRNNNFDAAGFVLEFMTSLLYNRALPGKRVPRIFAVKTANDYGIGLASRALPGFQTISAITKGAKDHILGANVAALQKVEDFVIVFVLALVFGEFDIHAGNIGVATLDDNKMVGAKIDHGFSATQFFSCPYIMLANFIRAFKIYNYTDNLTLNLHAFKKAIDQILQISIDEVQDLIKIKTYQLKKLGFELGDLIFPVWHNDLYHTYNITDPAFKRKTFTDWAELEEFYIDKFSTQWATLKRFSEEVLHSIELDISNGLIASNWVDISNETLTDDMGKVISKEPLTADNWLRQLSTASIASYTVRNNIMVADQNPIVWAACNSIPIYGFPALVWAANNFIRFGTENPIVWGHRNSILVNGYDIIIWCALYGQNIDGKAALVWGQENNLKIMGLSPILYVHHYNYLKLEMKSELSTASSEIAKYNELGNNINAWFKLQYKVIRNKDVFIEKASSIILEFSPKYCSDYNTIYSAITSGLEEYSKGNNCHEAIKNLYNYNYESYINFAEHVKKETGKLFMLRAASKERCMY